jgi:hypothetical protein
MERVIRRRTETEERSEKNGFSRLEVVYARNNWNGRISAASMSILACRLDSTSLQANVLPSTFR